MISSWFLFVAVTGVLMVAGVAGCARRPSEQGASIAAANLNGDALVDAARVGDVGKLRLLLERQPDAKVRNEALLAVSGFAVANIAIKDDPSSGAKATGTPEKARGDAPAVPAMDQAEAARLLIASGVNIEVRDEDGRTPLMQAAAFGVTGVLHVLLDAGADVEAIDSEGNTALMSAACACAQASMNDTLDAVKALLAKGANVNARDTRGSTALIVASGWGQTAIAQVLLDNGATIDARDNDGNTALLNAVSGGALPVADVVRLLLARKASVNARNKHGDTALGLAVKNDQTDAVRLLRQAMGKETSR